MKTLFVATIAAATLGFAGTAAGQTPGCLPGTFMPAYARPDAPREPPGPRPAPGTMQLASAGVDASYNGRPAEPPPRIGQRYDNPPPRIGQGHEMPLPPIAAAEPTAEHGIAEACLR
jgi:hypothetical protein